ncbi:putative secreted protein [Pseudomonas migulae]|nr:putative secreted protein [Pseudomonas migulae]
MLAMAISRAPSPASRLLRMAGVLGILGSRKTCRSPACRRWRCHGRYRQQAGSYGSKGCWGWWVHPKLVGAGLPAMAMSRALSPASWLLRIAGVLGIVGSPKTCRSPACWRWRFHGRYRQQAGSYGSRGCWGLWVHPKLVGAGLLAMAMSWAPSPASWLLRIARVLGIVGSPKTCRSRLAGDGDVTGAIASKLAPTDRGGVGDCGFTRNL